MSMSQPAYFSRGNRSPSGKCSSGEAVLTLVRDNGRDGAGGDTALRGPRPQARS